MEKGGFQVGFTLLILLESLFFFHFQSQLRNIWEERNFNFQKFKPTHKVIYSPLLLAPCWLTNRLGVIDRRDSRLLPLMRLLVRIHGFLHISA